MDIITKEVIKSILKRIAKLEEKTDYHRTIINNPPKTKPNSASERAKDYLKSLGGNPNNSMSKKECGELIDSLLKGEKIKQTAESVVEPKEVDTEEAGIDEVGLL